MHSKQFLKWLEGKDLLNIARHNHACFKPVFHDCLGAKDEDVLIICDNGYPNKRVAPIMAASYYFAAQKLNLKPQIVVQSPKIKGEKASDAVIDCLKKLDKGSILVLCLSHRLGHVSSLGKSYRKFAYTGDHKFVSSPSLGSTTTDNFFSFIDSIHIDYAKLRERAREIKNVLDWGKEVTVKTKAGTDLTFSIRGRSAVANDASYMKKGSGGNIPAGEVYIAPRKNTAEGKVVIDGTITHHWGTSAVRGPVTLTIERGQVTDITGGADASILKKTLDIAYSKSKYPWGLRHMGEFGVGINPKARMIGATILDEKVLGTAHIALGSNYWFGGSIYSKIHIDQVFKNPIIHVDGKLLKV